MNHLHHIFCYQIAFGKLILERNSSFIETRRKIWRLIE
jgi:hypothetical protein